jgi:hypothetical protein
MVRKLLCITVRLFGPALAVLPVPLLLVTACGKRAPSDFILTALPIPADKFEPIQVEHGAVLGEYMFTANTIAPRGSGAPRLAVAIGLGKEGSGFAANQIASLILKPDTFPQCLLPDGAIVMSEGMLSKTPKFWAFSREGKRDLTPENLLDVVSRKHLPGVGVRFCDSQRNLYVVLRKKGMNDGPDELWVGQKVLKQVTSVADVISEATALKEGTLRYAVLTGDMQVHTLNPETLAFEEDPAYAWFSSALQSDKSLSGETPRHPVVTELMGAISLKDEIRIYSKSGGIQSILKFSTVDETPAGLPRSRAAVQQIINNQLYLRKEGETLPTDFASTKTRPVLVSDDVIALVDTDYCRIVFVKVAAPTTKQP